MHVWGLVDFLTKITMCSINTLLDTLEQSAPVWVLLTMTHIHKDAVTLKKSGFFNPVEYQNYIWHLLSSENKQLLEEIMLIVADWSQLNHLTKHY